MYRDFEVQVNALVGQVFYKFEGKFRRRSTHNLEKLANKLLPMKTYITESEGM